MQLVRAARYAPVTGLAVLFVVSVAFSLSPAVTREYVAVTALGTAATLGFGGLVILADPRRAAEHDSALTPPDANPAGAALTIMTASGLLLALLAIGLAGMAVRLL